MRTPVAMLGGFALLASSLLLTGCYNDVPLSVTNITLTPTVRDNGLEMNKDSSSTVKVGNEYVLPAGRAGTVQVSFTTSKHYDMCQLDFNGRLSLRVEDGEGGGNNHYVAFPTTALDAGASADGSLTCDTGTVGSTPELDTFHITIRRSAMPVFAPSQIDFGLIAAGENARADLRIANEGTENLRITAIVNQDNTTNVPYSISDENCAGKIIPPQRTCMLIIVFSPPSAGSWPQHLTVISNGINPIPVLLKGTAAASRTPVFRANGLALSGANTIRFGEVETGQSGERTIAVSNDGIEDMRVSAVRVEGENANDFKISYDNCTGLVTNNIPCATSVTFSPTNAGDKNATLVYVDNAAGSPHKITLLGTGKASSPPPAPEPTYSPPPYTPGPP